MAVSVCPRCHERFRYDSREELEVLTGDVAVVVPDSGPLRRAARFRLRLAG